MSRLGRTLRALVRPGALIAGIGLVGVGWSGALAGLMAAVLGPSFVTGDIPGDAYTPGRCTELLRLVPGSPTCEQAAIAHHLDEVISYRLAAGVLGIVILIVWAVLNRRKPSPEGVLPERFTATVGATLFVAAGALFVLDGLGRLVLGTNAGAGASLSGAVVSLALGAAFAVAFVRPVR